MGLSLAVLVLALVIPVLVVLKAPEPPPSGYSLTEAVTALKTGEVRLQNGHRLKAITVSARPAFIDKAPDATDSRALRTYNFQAGIAQKLAAELHVPTDTVFVHIPPHRSLAGGPRTFAFKRDGFPGGGPNVMTSQAPPNDFPRPDQAPDQAQSAREGPASDLPPAARTFNPGFGGNRGVTFNGETVLGEAQARVAPT